MLNNKLRKRIMIPVLAMMLVVAMTGAAFAHSSNYSMTLPTTGYGVEYDTHLYGSSSDTYFYDNNTSSTIPHKSCLHDSTLSCVATAHTGYISSGGYATAVLYSKCRTSSAYLRIMSITDMSQTATSYGRYGVD